MNSLRTDHPPLLIATPACSWCAQGGDPHKCLGCAAHRAAVTNQPDAIPDAQLMLDLAVSA